MYMESRLIVLNSENSTKLNGEYNSNLVFNIPNIVDENKDISYLECSLEDATIPVSWYLINDSNNTLHYNYNSINDSITLTNGNYNGSSIITEIQNKFVFDKSINMEVVLSQVTGKLTFRIANAISNIVFYYNLSTNLMRILGFNETISGVAFTTPRPMNLLGIQKIQICSNSLGTIGSFSSSPNLSSGVIQSVPVDTPSFHQITYINKGTHYGRMKQRYLDNIDIQLFDEFGTFLEMNGIEFTLTILIRIFRKITVSHDNINVPQNIPKEVKKDLEKSQEKDDDEENDEELQLLLGK